MTAPVEESPALLKRTIDASTSLARLDASLLRSALRPAFGAVMQKLDVAGALILEGRGVEVELVLTASDSQQKNHFKRALAQRKAAVHAIALSGIDVATVEGIAGACVSGGNTIRSRALGVRERQGVAAGVKTANNAEVLSAGLNAWIHFVERGAADVESLLLAGAAYRRWIQLRPYASANVSIAASLVDALLRLEGAGTSLTLPLSWRFARFAIEYRQATATRDEHDWHLWWLGCVAAAATECLDVLLAWEAEVQTLQTRAAVKALENDAVFVLSRPTFDLAEMVHAAGVSRARVQRYLEALVERGDLRVGEGNRTRRYINQRVVNIVNIQSQ